MVIFKTDPRYAETRLKKPCNIQRGGCGKMFRPTSKFTTLCDECQEKSRRKTQERIVKRNKKKKTKA